MKMFQKFTLLTASLLLAASLPALADTSASVGNAVNDTVITAKIKSGLTTDSVTHAASISVETNNGIVTLTGTANSETEAAKAVEIAESTNDVKNVNASGLKVANSDQPMTDAYITAKVKGVFLKNNLTSGQENVPLASVKVETQQGVVYLSGTVEKHSQIAKLTNLAKTVDGVTKVKSALTVSAAKK